MNVAKYRIFISAHDICYRFLTVIAKNLEVGQIRTWIYM